MRSIVWLASHPKSGNTWLRMFLSNYVFNPEQPMSINQINKLGFGDSGAKLFQMITSDKVDSSDPKHAILYRSKVLKGIVANKADVNFVKTHNLNGVAMGAHLIPYKLTRSAIYIVRNPMDMLVSFSKHYGLTLDEAIHGIGHQDHALQGGTDDSMYQFLGTWSNHVTGWTSRKKYPVLTLRYEDMKSDPHGTFTKVIKHIGLPLKEDLLDKAVRFSNFKTLQAQESEQGFVESSLNSGRFFRSGEVDQWKKEFTDEQVAQVMKDHGRVMKKFRYEV